MRYDMISYDMTTLNNIKSVRGSWGNQFPGGGGTGSPGHSCQGSPISFLTVRTPMASHGWGKKQMDQNRSKTLFRTILVYLDRREIKFQRI